MLKANPVATSQWLIVSGLPTKAYTPSALVMQVGLAHGDVPIPASSTPELHIETWFEIDE
jgi:hypothetical protein